jgi:hypothetical protein
MKSAAPQPIGFKLLKPISWVAESLAWLTNASAKGGSKFVLYGMVGYCFALSSETIYIAMPKSATTIQAGVENVRFLPKPGIPDNASLGRLNPIPAVGSVAIGSINWVGQVLPFYRPFAVSRQWTVWADPHWYIAMGISLLVQGIEARSMRRIKNSWNKKKRRFDDLNSKEVPSLNPNAIVAARAAQASLVTEGLGEYVGVAMVTAGVYAIEFYCFFRSVSGLNVGSFTTFIYALINIFGFELCWSMTQAVDDE